MTSNDFPPLKNDLILRVARGEKVERAPCWIMRQAGRYLPGSNLPYMAAHRVEFREVRKHHDFFAICESPELACKITLQPIDRYSGLLDASIIFCDILVIPKAMGMTIQMIEAKGPTFDDPLVTPEDIKKLKMSVDIKKELGYVMDAISLTRRELNGRVPLFGFIGAPWTLLAYMIEGGGSKTLTKAKGWLYKYPQETKNLLQRITDIAIDFLAEQIIAGAQVHTLLSMINTRWCKCLIHGLENCRLPTLRYFHYRIFFKFLPSCTRYSNQRDTILPIRLFLQLSLPRERGTLWRISLKVTIMSSVSIGLTILCRREKEWDQVKFFKGIWIRMYYTAHKPILPRKLRELYMDLEEAREDILST